MKWEKIYVVRMHGWNSELGEPSTWGVMAVVGRGGQGNPVHPISLRDLLTLCGEGKYLLLVVNTH